MRLLTFSALVLVMLNAVVAFGQTSTTFTANATFTIPATATSVKVETWGAGGKGGNSNSIFGGGGGGGGGYSAQTFSDLAGATLNINFDGNAKVTRTVNGTPTNLVLANNGNPGGASTPSADGAGGAGGSTTGAVGTLQYSGGDGLTGFSIGGGFRVSGEGGPSGGPGGGYGGFRVSSGPGLGGSDGRPGGDPGGGGSGAIFGSGGNGGAGKVIITVTDCTPQTYYLDADGDGYYVSTVLACTSPGLGYTTTEGTLGDCNDDNNLVWQSASLYIDGDGDGYDAGQSVVCYGATPPAGYSTSTNGTDCNDNNPLAQTVQTWYLDADGDTHFVSSILSCGTPGIGYNTTGGTLGDCDDEDNMVWQSASLYIDADGDGYDAGQEPVCYGATIPAGYKIATMGSDCNDNKAAINPGAPEVCDGIDNNCNGQTDEGYTNTDGDLMADCVDLDDDNDGIADTDDCAPLDAGKWRTGNFYVDGDGDGYGTGSSVPLCYGATTPTGYITVGGDCNDANAAIKPGAVEICGNGIDDNCSGAIDENCGPCQNAISFITTNITSGSAKLNWVASVDPVQWQVQYKTTKNGSKWIDVTVVGNQRSVVISSLLAAQDYMWHIRAKCGTAWTDYSGAVRFKTLPVAGSLVTINTVSKPSIMAEQLPMELKVQNYPNPFTSVTTIRYTLPVEAQVNISVYNQLGQKVAMLVNAKQPAGTHQVNFDAAKSGGGIYQYQLQTKDANGKTMMLSGKMVMIK